MSFEKGQSDEKDGEANQATFMQLQNQIAQLKFNLRKKELKKNTALYKVVPRDLSKEETLEIFKYQNELRMTAT